MDKQTIQLSMKEPSHLVGEEENNLVKNLRAELAQALDDFESEKANRRRYQQELKTRAFEDLHQVNNKNSLSYAVVLLDINPAICTFQPRYLQDDQHGGLAAIRSLLEEVEHYLQGINVGVRRKMIKVHAYSRTNGDDRSRGEDIRTAAGVASRSFRNGFNREFPMVELFDFGNDGACLDEKICANLKLYFNDPGCQHIVLGLSPESKYMNSLRDNGINPTEFNRLTLLETRGGKPKNNTLDNLRTLRLDTVFDLEPVHRYSLTVKRETPDRGSTMRALDLQSNSRPAEAGPGHRDAKRPPLHSFVDASRSDIAHWGERANLTYRIPESSTLRSAVQGSRLGACLTRPRSENTHFGELQPAAETSAYYSNTWGGDTRSDPQSPGSSTLPSASNPPNPNLAISKGDTRSTPAKSDPRMEGPTAGRSNLDLALRNQNSPRSPRTSRPESQHHALGAPKSDPARRQGLSSATPQAPRSFTLEPAQTIIPSSHRVMPPSSLAPETQTPLANPDAHHIQDRVVRIFNPSTGERHDRALNIALNDPFLYLLRTASLCRRYYLQGTCDGHPNGIDRNHNHPPLNDHEFDCLLHLAREELCWNLRVRGKCHFPRCVYGHDQHEDSLRNNTERIPGRRWNRKRDRDDDEEEIDPAGRAHRRSRWS